MKIRFSVSNLIQSAAFFLLLFMISCTEKTNSYSVLDFGAKSDGQTLNTKSINAAIQKCHDQGGGTVLIPAGTFITGTIHLLSNINLHLEAGAVLSGSKDTLDYMANESPLFSEGYTHYGIIYAKNARNISITGEGQIHGNGTWFMHDLSKLNDLYRLDKTVTRQGLSYMKAGTISEDGPLYYDYRPGMLFTFDHCENIHLTDIYIKDAPEWTMRIGDCDNVAIRGITINNNPLIPNNDGIHCTTSRNIRISDCNIYTGDDGIIVTGLSNKNPDMTDSIGNKTGMAENVTVTNCILSSRSSCIRIGAGEHAIRNLVFDNLVMYASDRGIGIFSRNESDIENVNFSNIIIQSRIPSGNWWGKGEPIHISAVKDIAGGNAGKIKNIRFSNITATAETGILIYGVPESIIEDVLFNKITLTINPGKNTGTYGGNFDLQPAYPANLNIFKHDIPGFYAQYVKGLTVSGFELNWGKGLQPFFTNGIEINHFEDIRIEDMKGSPAFELKDLFGIHLSDGAGAILQNNEGPGQTAISNIKLNVR